MNKDVVVLIPSYNPDEEIMSEFLAKLHRSFKNIVIVNDGSSECHSDYFSSLEKKYPVIRHNINLGKGRAMKNGINYILNNYPDASAIVMADCDGQHSVDDIKKVVDVAKVYNDSLVLGVRDFDKSGVPKRSRLGNVITRNVLNLFVGPRVSDTQTGLRAMSLDVAKSILEIPGERYEYETNVLIASKNNKLPIKEVVIETIYINDNKTSHFNPVKDSIRVYKMFARYLLVSLLSYIIEVIAFSKLLDKPTFFLSIVLYLIIAKIISSLITFIVNKHIDLALITVSIVFNSLLLLALQRTNANLILIKIIIDFIVLVLGILLTSFETKKIIKE